MFPRKLIAPAIFFFVIAVVVGVFCTSFYPNGAHVASAPVTKHGPNVLPGASPEPVATGAMPVRVAISDQDSKAIIERLWGSEAAAAARRVTQPDQTLQPTTPIFHIPTLVNEPSGNWCGYRSQVSNVKGAQGTFNVRFNTTGFQSSWIGLGYAGTVLQAGIDGAVTHAAWIEYYPADSDYYFAVNQGDTINVSAGLDLYTGYWVAVVYDATTGQYASEAFTTPADTKAAWIVEKMSGYQLGTFGTIRFSSCKWWNAGGTTYNINQGTGNYYREYLQSSGGTQVWPSVLSGGNSFSVTRN